MTKCAFLGKSRTLLASVRSGLILLIPVIFIGSFSLLLFSLPIAAYQNFIHSFGNGVLAVFFNSVDKITLGMLSFYMVLAITSQLLESRWHGMEFLPFVCIVTVTACFLILVGFFNQNFTVAGFSGSGMASAIVAALLGTHLYLFFERKCRHTSRPFLDGITNFFSYAVKATLPAALTIGVFAVANMLIVGLFHANCFQNLFEHFLALIFSHQKKSYFVGILYLLISSGLWFIGLHGGNIIEPQAADLFRNSGAEAILSKSFVDVFVIMGGCGTAIGLFLSLLLFSKRKSSKKLALISAFPVIFNINELIIFGVPVIFNRFLLIPFILAPVCTYTISYAAMYWGLVPVVCNSVEWTTPVLLSGYLATNSVGGSILQVLNIVISVLIYRPFVLMNDKNQLKRQNEYFDELLAVFKECEKDSKPIHLMDIRSSAGNVARSLANDLLEAISAGAIDVNYQPQMNGSGTCVGAEALMRWRNSAFGIVYPPLVIKLAKETDCLWRLEQLIIEKSAADYAELKTLYGDGFKLSINITVASLYHPEFVEYVTNLKERYHFAPGNICFEITEEMELRVDDETSELFRTIRALGYTFALDDFSMGHTSLQYLQRNRFDFVKLDGAIVRDMMVNPRSKEIIASIVHLSRSLDFDVIAEFVETVEQKEMLADIGCRFYQGYLYSPARSVSDLKGTGGRGDKNQAKSNSQRTEESRQ